MQATHTAAPRQWMPQATIVLTHALVWAVAASLARGNLDIPGDMVENFVWGQEWQAGYAKHPPLFAWVTAAWFTLWPRADWAYFALSSCNAAVGLCAVAALARRFVPRDAATVAMAALALSPLYTGLAIKFNANAMLLSTWPWAAYFFVVWMQQGRIRHAVACGAVAGLAMLAKYFSVVLVLAFVGVCLVRPGWRRRLTGATPWAATAAFVAVVSPHLAWLVHNHFAPLGYAAQRGSGTFTAAALRYLNYSAAQVGYLLLSAGLVLLVVMGGQRRAAARVLVSSWAQVRAVPDLWWLAFAPLIVTGAIALVARTPMASVWGMAQWFAITALWLALLQRAGVEINVRRLRVVLPVYWGLVLTGAAAAGYVQAHREVPLASEPRAELAETAQRLWRERTGRDLEIVSGSPAQAASIAFYAHGRVRWWQQEAPLMTPWLTAEQVQQQGVLIVCAGAPGACDTAAAELTHTPPLTVVERKTAWGRVMAPYSYRLFLLLPRAAAAT